VAKRPKPTKPGKPIRTPSRTKYRSAKTGRYVTKSYAKRNPKTTVRESGKKNRRKK
jgi:hypothetical protein